LLIFVKDFAEVMIHSKIFIPDYVTREYRKLLRLVHHSAQSADVKQIRLAFTFANEACKKFYNKLHEPYIMQALQVAQIVASDIGLGTSSIVCSLLYKFVENGSLDSNVVKENFGEKISVMTDELAKIATINTLNTRTQAENFRKLLLTLTSDVRVILIKLADRLYVMRNLDAEDTEFQMRMAHETLDLYAPLGHRLGLYSVKTELEDLSMKYSNADMYQFIVQKLQDTAAKRNRFIKDFVSPIIEELNAQEFDYEVKSRTKSVFSIWNKMRKQNVEFEEVYDLFAVRIILNSELKHEKADCWRVFSVVTGLYQPNTERMRDWISVPKSNGYESLHATVVVPGGKWVEVQIRTRRMDEIAEKGLAAHWKYKGQKGDSGLDSWLNKFREILESPDSDAVNMMDTMKLNLYSKEIFVFTPKGDLRMLPKDATVLDFAYDIHSNVGCTCVGAKVNGKNVPIRFVLKNGDKVEIITSVKQKPKSDWLDFAITSKAKAKIKVALKEEKMKEAENGKEIFKRRLRNWKIPFNDLIVSRLLKQYKLKNSIDFYSMIASEAIEMTEIKSLITTTNKSEVQGAERIGEVPVEKIIPALSGRAEEVLEIDDKVLSNVDYKLSKCCNPIFGDEIFGFVTISDGIKIHRVHCPNASQMISRFGYRVVKAKWAGKDSQTYFLASIKLSGVDEIGILSKISDIIAKDLSVNLRSINMDTSNGHFEGIIRLFVKDVNRLDMLLQKLIKVKGIDTAQRIEGI
jgi:GTP diphosphokinase / guanosine-3',5'-bis(diphosphate) 3'-diphosphatase